jgi:hypothetical protein
MAQVPYKPVPELTPSGGGTPRLSVVTPEDAFGGGVARGISEIGRAVGRAGDELFTTAMHIQDMETATVATRANINLDSETSDVIEGYLSKQGNQVNSETLKEVKAKLAELREKHGEGLTPAARKKYEHQSLITTLRAGNRALTHTLHQVKESSLNTELAGIDTIIKGAGLEPFNEELNKENRKQIDQRAARVGAQKGWDDKQTNILTDEFQAAYTSKLLMGMSQQDPGRAKEELEKHSVFLGKYEKPTRDVVEANYYSTEVRNKSNAIVGDLSEVPAEGKLPKTLDQMLKEADKAAGGDPRLEKELKADIRFKWGVHQQSMTEARQINNNDTSFWLNGGHTGQPPKSVDKFREMSPEADALWLKADEKQRTTITNAIQHNIVLAGKPTEEGRERLRELRDMGNSNTETVRAEFADLDLSEEHGLGDAGMKEMVALQKKVIKGYLGDPRVNVAMGKLKGWFAQNAPILNTDAKAKGMFEGALYTALNEWKLQHGKGPDDDELRLIASRLIRDTPDPSTFFGHAFGLKSQFYKLGVPEPALPRLFSLPAWKETGLDPNSAEGKKLLQQLYVRTEYEKKYGKKKPTAKVGPLEEQ